MSTVTLLFIGILIAQLLYVAANGWQYKRKDYLYYFLYLCVLLVYLVILNIDAVLGIKVASPVGKKVFQSVRGIAFAGYALYFRFIRSFLQPRKHSPRLHHRIRWVEITLWALALVYLVWENSTGRTIISTVFYFTCSLLLFVAIIVLIGSLWRHPVPLSRFVLRGAIALACGAFISNLVIIYHLLNQSSSVGFYLLPLLLGTLAELFFFNNGLSYKTHQTELKLIASQQRVISELRQKEQLQERLQGIRQKISRDLHDEIGSGLSSIRLLTETAVMQQNGHAGGSSLLKKIASTAKDLGGKISEIIWAGNSTKDNLESLLLFVRQYAHEYLAQADIGCQCLLPATIPAVALDGEMRRNIFLVVKEALHNVVKHAAATNVVIDMAVQDQAIIITVADNGNGLPQSVGQTRGNGLQNMRYRVEKEAGGSFQLQSDANGTSIALCIPLPTQVTT